jgi:8-oxo-dGTP pyrophosphatase MutT (NUDIX family)
MCLDFLVLLRYTVFVMKIIPPSNEELETLRRSGMRPQVVGCFLREGKVLFVYSEQYDLWMFPQGGIDNGETPFDALKREMQEELGETFCAEAMYEQAEFFLKTVIPFPVKKHGTRELHTDDGEPVKMIGKTYFAAFVPAGTKDIVLDESEFDDAMWLHGADAYTLINQLYQRRKQVQMRKIVDVLLKEGKLR